MNPDLLLAICTFISINKEDLFFCPEARWTDVRSGVVLISRVMNIKTERMRIRGLGVSMLRYVLALEFFNEDL